MNKPFGLPPLAILLLLACLLFFLGLGELGLTDRDEGSNAEAAREMFETGNWISPTLNYEPRFAKPALTYWLMSGAYWLLGVNEFAARFHSALFGFLLILLQYLFLTRVCGQTLALLASLMLLLNIEIVAIGRLALTDAVLIFFTTLSLFGFWLGFHGEGRERHFLWLFYAGMAIGTLTKGPVGVAVPLLAVIPYLTVTRRWGQFWQRGFPIAGTLLFLLLAVPWYAAMLTIHGSRYTASAHADTIGRFVNIIGGHGGTVFFYIPILLFGFFPWSGFLPAALYATFKNWRKARGERREARGLAPNRSSRDELDLFAALWLAAVFLFFSLSATRLPHYIGPLYPAAAILVASYWTRCLNDPTTPGIRASIHTLMGLGYLMGFALAVSPNLYSAFLDQVTKEYPMGAQVGPGLSPIAIGLILIIGSALVGYFGLSEQRRAGAFWAAGSTIVLVLLIAIQIAIPHFSRHFVAPPQTLAYTAGVNLRPEDRLILYGRPRPSFMFYARHKAIVVKAGEEANMRPHLSHPGRTMILLQSRLKPKLPEEAADYHQLLELSGYTLLSSERMVGTGS